MEKLEQFIKDLQDLNFEFINRKEVLNRITEIHQALQLQKTDVMQRNCNSLGCVDPDNSGKCIYCGKILDND